MKISEFLHLALPEEQWLPTISGVLRQFAEEECYVYERQPCWYLGKGCGHGCTLMPTERRRHLLMMPGSKMGGGFHCRLRASFYGASSGERTSGIWTGWVQLCGACAGIAFNAGEWPLLTLTVPREELILKREMSPFMRTPPTGADVCASG